MKLPWAAPAPIEDEVYIDLTERLAPYTKDPEVKSVATAPASFMSERPLRARPEKAAS